MFLVEREGNNNPLGQDNNVELYLDLLDHSWSRRINFVCEQVNRATRIIQETKSVLPKGAKRAGLVESIKDN